MTQTPCQVSNRAAPTPVACEHHALWAVPICAVRIWNGVACLAVACVVLFWGDSLLSLRYMHDGLGCRRGTDVLVALHTLPRVVVLAAVWPASLECH